MVDSSLKKQDSKIYNESYYEMNSRNDHSIQIDKESEYKIFNIETKRSKEEERKIEMYMKLREQYREKYLGDDNDPLADGNRYAGNLSQSIVKVYDFIVIYTLI